jgi:hypothetical protein
VREISHSVTPFDTAFRTAFLIRFTAYFFFSSAISCSTLQLRLRLYDREAAGWRLKG